MHKYPQQNKQAREIRMRLYSELRFLGQHAPPTGRAHTGVTGDSYH